MGEIDIVFGGAGFIATHLLRRLVQESGRRLISVDIRDPVRPVAGVEYLRGDVRDLSGFTVDWAGGTVGTLYNLAAIHVTPGHPNHAYYETNIAGATQITALAHRLGAPRIVFTSSISVYGPSESSKNEDTRPAPESAYGWSKLLAEQIHQAWLEQESGRRLVICRPAVVFGAGEGGNFTRLAGLLRQGIFVYPGRKDTIKACIYVEDLLDALAFAQANADRSVLFNGAYPDRYTLEQIVETFRQQYFPKARTVMVPQGVVVGLATLLRPISALGLGIHPDRVMKLVRSTDVIPGWLTAHGLVQAERLPQALARWDRHSQGMFT